jgi:hypothetical protein
MNSITSYSANFLLPSVQYDIVIPVVISSQNCFLKNTQDIRLLGNTIDKLQSTRGCLPTVAEYLFTYQKFFETSSRVSLQFLTEPLDRGETCTNFKLLELHGTLILEDIHDLSRLRLHSTASRSYIAQTLDSNDSTYTAVIHAYFAHLKLHPPKKISPFKPATLQNSQRTPQNQNQNQNPNPKHQKIMTNPQKNAQNQNFTPKKFTYPAPPKKKPNPEEFNLSSTCSMASDQLYGSPLNSEIDLTAPKNHPKRVAISDDELLLPKFCPQILLPKKKTKNGLNQGSCWERLTLSDDECCSGSNGVEVCGFEGKVVRGSSLEVKNMVRPKR